MKLPSQRITRRVPIEGLAAKPGTAIKSATTQEVVDVFSFTDQVAGEIGGQLQPGEMVGVTQGEVTVKKDLEHIEFVSGASIEEFVVDKEHGIDRHKLTLTNPAGGSQEIFGELDGNTLVAAKANGERGRVSEQILADKIKYRFTDGGFNYVISGNDRGELSGQRVERKSTRPDGVREASEVDAKLLRHDDGRTSLMVQDNGNQGFVVGVAVDPTWLSQA